MIRRTTDDDFEIIWDIVNDAAQAYKDIIPADRWHEPYMPCEDLRQEIAAGVDFWCFESNGAVLAVMGIQAVRDVYLIRHAYTRTTAQGRGIGAQLLAHLHAMAARPMLIGTWTNATWAIKFYLKHNFSQVDWATKEHLLRTYWSIPERQIETSVVLADSKWFAEQRTTA